ncbi:unnamed protein product (macronuclear) [Paramecium tetraurelia]|uniref:Cyclic nucleotide-binding domain-containing protein n=1 Tax=Paramecium tetraurelia TaxID=5888 RepID=A0EGS2_PARTE|nr:uncharacterized protein GSPATT00026837001 [Paramecium tetraurelia]CAK94513.1 unnamed protein product [Paramecium tetraurelia]|eukprot:XP_001461886.1 hypothetical protein (macronuclear) [Paramecium tetraurelia strain d4-2]
MQYPCQPKDSITYDLNGFDLDIKEHQVFDSYSNRSKQQNSQQMIILAERSRITSPSVKKRKQKLRMAQIIQKFVEKIKISNNLFTKQLYVNTLLQTYSNPIHKENTNSKDFFQRLKYYIAVPISSQCKFRQLWKLLMQITYLTTIIFSPLILIYPSNIEIQTLLIILFSLTVLNSVLNLNTCYYKNGVEVTHLRKIQQNYIRRYGLQDLLQYLSFIFILQFCESNFTISVLALITLNLLIVRLIKLNTLISQQLCVRLGLQFIKGVSYCHVFSLISISNKYQIQFDPLGLQINSYLNYLNSYISQYFSFSSNLEYETNFELLLALLVQLIFTINRISLILDILFFFNQNVHQYLLQKNYFDFKAYLLNHQVDQNLMKKALSNYKFEMKKDFQQQNFMIDSKSIKYIDQEIQKALWNTVNVKYFKKILVLTQFSQNIQEKLVENMQLQYFQPNEIILRQNCNDDDSMYLIKRGQVKVCYQSNNTKQVGIKTLGEMQTFGEVSFFTGLPRTSTIVSLGPVETYKIRRSDFLEAIQSSRQDLELASYMKDQILHNNQYGLIGLQCFCCNSNEHLIFQCDALHYKPDKEKIISKYQFDHHQLRTRYKRNKKRTNNTRQYLFQIGMVGEEFQENNFLGDQSEILKELTQNYNQQSSTYIQQNQSQAFFPSREIIKSSDKNSILLISELDDIKEQFQDLDSMIHRKDKSLFPQNNTFQIKNQVIQELDGEDQSSHSEDNIPNEICFVQLKSSSENKKQNNIMLNIPDTDKVQDTIKVNSCNLLQQQNNSCMIPNTQENKNYRQGRKSLSSTQLHSQQIDISKKNENLRLPSIQKNGDDFDLNPSDRSSPPINKKNKSPQQNKIRVEENPANFIDLNNSSHFFCLDDKDELDKAQNYLFYYPYQNPEFIISLQELQNQIRYNNVKVHRIQKFNKKSPYTISFVISEKIKQKAIMH